MPILLVVGTHGTAIIQDVAAAIAREARPVQRVDLPGVGHMVNLEAPEAFPAAVDAFLARQVRLTGGSCRRRTGMAGWAGTGHSRGRAWRRAHSASWTSGAAQL